MYQLNNRRIICSICNSAHSNGQCGPWCRVVHEAWISLQHAYRMQLYSIGWNFCYFYCCFLPISLNSQPSMFRANLHLIAFVLGILLCLAVCVFTCTSNMWTIMYITIFHSNRFESIYTKLSWTDSRCPIFYFSRFLCILSLWFKSSTSHLISIAVQFVVVLEYSWRYICVTYIPYFLFKSRPLSDFTRNAFNRSSSLISS